MSPVIRIDDQIYSWLQAQARPFEDTPNSVLRRLAGLESSGDEGRESRTVRAKPRSGGKTPQYEFRDPIMSVLQKHGGQAKRAVVLGELEKLMAGRLTSIDKENLESGAIRWQKSAEWEVRVMREKGLLKRVDQTESGVWALAK